MIGENCNLHCPDFGYCKSAAQGSVCEGFESVIDTDENEERLERATY